MKRRPLSLLIAVGVVVAAHTGAAVDIVPSERTLAERLRHMDAVLRVRAISEPVVRAEDMRDANPELRSLVNEPVLTPIIEQEVEVLEVIKGRSVAVAGTTIRVGTSGGHNGMHLDSWWRESRTMVVGGTYVLFLKEHPIFEQLRYYYFDMFRIDPPRVTTLNDQTVYAKVLLRMTPAESLAHIRSAVKSSQP